MLTGLLSSSSAYYDVLAMPCYGPLNLISILMATLLSLTELGKNELFYSNSEASTSY